jgi:hypothetical protein
MKALGMLAKSLDLSASDSNSDNWESTATGISFGSVNLGHEDHPQQTGLSPPRSRSMINGKMSEREGRCDLCEANAICRLGEQRDISPFLTKEPRSINPYSPLNRFSRVVRPPPSVTSAKQPASPRIARGGFVPGIACVNCSWFLVLINLLWVLRHRAAIDCAATAEGDEGLANLGSWVPSVFPTTSSFWRP